VGHGQIPLSAQSRATDRQHRISTGCVGSHPIIGRMSTASDSDRLFIFECGRGRDRRRDVRPCGSGSARAVPRSRRARQPGAERGLAPGVVLTGCGRSRACWECSASDCPARRRYPHLATLSRCLALAEVGRVRRLIAGLLAGLGLLRRHRLLPARFRRHRAVLNRAPHRSQPEKHISSEAQRERKGAGRLHVRRWSLGIED
jgi:hypothetical protein